MRIDVVTLFPDMIREHSGYGIQARAIENGLLELVTWNPRDFTTDRHGGVDDRPYGGGPGMVMQVQPLRDTLRAARQALAGGRVIYLSPQGRRFTQDKARELAGDPRLILVCGRYEGVDERFIDTEVDEELSIGDYVLSGGELPALVVMDAVTRLLPGALGDANSAEEDSFMDGLLDYPHFTRPEVIDGLRVPEELLGGHHEVIRCWRTRQALGRTWLRRPDLLEDLQLDEEQQALLDEFIRDNEQVIE
ncbi:MAG: tRNA (guanosine(37)-N1)-methyltransferase TrmD [Gammaproteobacteria bacterium]